ncbi:MAG: B12-binding domain-containing radical SAM protein [Candidatus Omnitrophica bacterium]|nr:B12-binding domain-containing radical SAM protein [Candidatus Omnitrophota bacterium]
MRIAFVLDNIILGQEPLGVTTMGALLKQHGHQVDYFDFPPQESKWNIDDVVAFQPDIVGYSISSGLHNRYLRFNRLLKEQLPNLFTIIGGPHPSFFPNFLEKEGVDAICVGEGEQPMLELANAMERGDSPYEVAGLHLKLPDGTRRVNPPRPYEQDLDKIPFPDHSFIRKFPHLRDSPIAYVMCGRGCPYNCNFCFNHVSIDLQAGRYTRYRSPENIIEECLELRDRYGKRYIAFQDDTFSLNYRFLEKFLPLYKEQVGLPYLAHLRADNITPKMAKLLGDTGCKRGVIGLENGNEDIRIKILDKTVTDEDIIRCSELLHDNSIEFLSQNMFGVPGETIETVLSTIELNIRAKADLMVIHFFQPYPGTDLARISSEMGLWEGTVDDIPESNHWFVVLDMKDKELMTMLGHLSYFMLDYPKAFYYLKPLIENSKSRKVAMPLLKLCKWLDQKTLYSKKRGVGSRWHPPKAIMAAPEATSTNAARNMEPVYCPSA